MSKRDKFIQDAKAQLDDLNKELARLEKNAAEVGQDVEDRYHDEVAKLREQSKKASAKIDEMKSAGEEQWNKLAGELTQVTDAMKHSFNYFKSQV